MVNFDKRKSLIINNSLTVFALIRQQALTGCRDIAIFNENIFELFPFREEL